MARAQRSGILFKTAASLEATGRTQIVALDKTGTITSGEPKVTDIVPDETFFEETGNNAGKLLAIAASVEAKSEHPLAKAIMERAKTDEIAVAEVTDFSAVVGNGSDCNTCRQNDKSRKSCFCQQICKSVR